MFSPSLHLSCRYQAQGEFLFVIDRSGSMEGQSIYAAREALALCVSSLPLGAKFNIISFGSNFVKWSPECESLITCRGWGWAIGWLS